MRSGSDGLRTADVDVGRARLRVPGSGLFRRTLGDCFEHGLLQRNPSYTIECNTPESHFP